MKKTVLVLMSVLLSIGMFSACSSDDDVTTPEVPETTSHSTRQLPNQADFIKTMTDIGYLKLDKEDNSWWIKAPYHGPEIRYDGGNIFYLYDLPEEYQKEGLKVKATLDCYTFRHFDERVEIVRYAGYDYYDAVLRDIEIVE